MGTWSTSIVTWTESVYTFSDFTTAYELAQVIGGRSCAYKREQIYGDLFKDRTKKRKVIQLIMKVKSNQIKQKVEIPLDTQIALSDIDMVIQEVLNKPIVNINVA